MPTSDDDHVAEPGWAGRTEADALQHVLRDTEQRLQQFRVDSAAVPLNHRDERNIHLAVRDILVVVMALGLILMLLGTTHTI